MEKKGVISIICCLLIFLFVYAALSKVMDYEKFSVQIGQSPLLTTNAGFYAWFVPTFETLIAVLLAIPGTRLIGLYLAFGLMILFSAYIIAILNFGVFVPCSCGGILQNMTWSTHLIFNLFFVMLCATGVYLEARVRYNTR